MHITSHLASKRVFIDIAAITRVANIINGFVYLALAVSFIIRNQSPSTVFFKTAIPLIPEAGWPIIFMVSSLFWFVPPRRFSILSLAVLPLVAAISVNMVYLIVHAGLAIWPIALYLAYLSMLGLINLACYIRINQREQN